MEFSSHRLRSEEKKLYRKVILTVFFIIIAFMIILFGGLPLLAKFILTISSYRNEKVTTSITPSSLILPPVLDPLVESTNSSTIKISGFGEKDAKIVILVNGKEQKRVSADKEGKFSVSNISLNEGENTISAKIVKDREESSSSSPMSIMYKKTPPGIEITSPDDGEKFSSENKEITITGKTEPESKVTINDRLVIVDAQGNFSYRVSLSDGENIFKIITIDDAGNTTAIEKKVTYIP